MSETVNFWSGEFGNEYLNRNRVDWVKRVPFWHSILDKTNAKSILEVGCNAGWNMEALRRLNNDLAITGVDVNQNALSETKARGFDVEFVPAHQIAYEFPHSCCDLVFTAGLLIHIPPNEIEEVMTGIRDVTAQYVVAVEYESKKEKMIKYRGNANRLWSRPFGEMYQKLGLDLVEYGKVGKPEGFDNCSWWLLEKHA